MRNLREVQNSLWEVRYKWKQIGVELGIHKSTLEVIMHNNSCDADNCFTSMLSEWLKCDSSCWKKLAEALQSKPVAVHVQKQTITAKDTTDVEVSLMLLFDIV